MTTLPLQSNQTTEAANPILYVSPTGKDTNSGTTTAPYKTIPKAINQASAGTTIYVDSGKYPEKISFKTSGTKSNPIILKANPSASSMSIITGACTGVEIRNCDVYNIANKNATPKANAHGIAVYGSSSTAISNLVIENNKVHDCILGQSESIVLNGNVKDFKLNYNQVYNNNNIGIDFIGYEGTASGENDRARQGECKHNYVYNITSANNPGYEGSRSADGIYVDGGSDILIYGNIVSNCDIGIEAASEHKNKSTDKISIINNLVMNCSSYAGICFGGSDSSINGTAREIIVENNTLYNNNCGIVIQNANSSTNVIKKNVIYQSNKGNAIYGKIATNIFKDNIIYQASGSISSTVKNNNIISTSSLISGSGTNIKVAPSYSKYGYVAPSEATPEGPTIKVDYDSNYVYIYAKTTSNYPSYQLLINSDNNSSPGLTSGKKPVF